MVHIAGQDRGVILLVGRSTCPWCMKTKALLANLSVGYYWIDLNTLNPAQTTEVISSLKICSDTSAVPILIIDNQRCIVGYQEDKIREAVG
jgi:glutaredoxin